MITPDDRLGLIAPLSWLVTSSPVLSAFLMFLVTPGGVWIARLIGGRILLPSDEFKSFKANIYFPLLLACNIALINSTANVVLITRNPVWVGIQLFLVIVWIVIGVLHRKGETHLMSKGQRRSLTSLYHDVVVYVIAGPTATVTTFVALFVGEWNFANFVLRMIVLWCVVAYVRGIIFDVRNADRKTFDGMTLLEVAHVDHSYPWQWMKREGHWRWWWDRFRSQIANDIPLLRRLHNS